MALAGGGRTVIEDVAQMAAAAAAMDLGAYHEQGPVGPGAHRVGKRPGEARPAGAAVELGGRAVHREIAAGAQEGAAAMLAVERAGARPLGMRLAQHRILGGIEALAPLGVGQAIADQSAWTSGDDRNVKNFAMPL